MNHAQLHLLHLLTFLSFLTFLSSLTSSLLHFFTSSLRIKAG